MERANKILRHPLFRICLHKNAVCEKNRAFCRHDFAHALTVARLCYLLLLERGCRHIPKDLAYAAGLLHDIGRWKEYRHGLDHARESARLAGRILDDAGYHAAEKKLIVKAIRRHRLKQLPAPEKHFSPLDKVLLEADRFSRPCCYCAAFSSCRPSWGRPVRSIQY